MILKVVNYHFNLHNLNLNLNYYSHILHIHFSWGLQDWFKHKGLYWVILRTFSVVWSKEAIDTNFVSSRERRAGQWSVLAARSWLPLLVIWLESHCYPFMSNSSMQWEAFVIPLCSTSPFILCVIKRDKNKSVVWRKITSWRQTGNALLSFKISPRASPGTPFGVWMLKYWGRDKYLNGILSKSVFMCPANTLTICSDYS